MRRECCRIKPKYSELVQIDNKTEISGENYSEFIYNLKLSLLMAMKELGYLGVMEYRYSEETLKKQRQMVSGREKK